MARRSYGGVVHRRPRRESIWFQISVAEATLSGSTLIHSLSAGALAYRPFTIVRSIIELGLKSDQAAAIESQIAAYGLAVVTDQAVAVGVSAVPTPITELSSDLWFMHKLLFANESALVDRTRDGTYASVDSRAMRKVEDGQDVVGVGQVSGFGAILTVAGRFLVKTA